MKLRDLITEDALDPRAADTEVRGVSADSRAVKPGDLFVAIAGAKADGARFISQAIAAGAVAVAAERAPDAPLPAGVAFVAVKNPRRTLSLAAATLFPRQPQTIAAVTGTAGKTSVAHFTRQIWERLGLRAGYLGTLGVVAPSGATYGNLTTPDPVTLHRTLDALAGEGVTHLAIEASSHGLDQHRLDGLRLSTAAFTNLGRDHLDYHPTMESYLAAKLRLFEELLPEGGAVVVPRGVQPIDGVDAVLAAARERGLKTLTLAAVSDTPGAQLPGGDIRARVAMRGFEQVLTFDPPLAGRASVTLPLTGFFQASNALLAAGLAIAGGAEPGAVIDALSHLKGVPGRLELVGRKDGAGIFVDYAHKPEALGEAIAALLPFREGGGCLIVVFGAGGDRDPGKRPLMGKIAAERADVVIVTDDNPRSEEPAAIRRAILAAAPGAREIGDRGEAIRRAIGELKRGDILLIAGKGHETGQIIGDRTIEFSDHAVVADALRETGT
jgi:UDP-N-acetylmuramoyl-L-alanyl-D-glutamate--2,6-diaminopimelate ligase